MSDSDIGAGFDRADGINQPFGTPTPRGAVTLRTAAQIPEYLEEDSDSPQVEYGEQMTFAHSYKMDINTAIAFQRAYHRGYPIFDSTGNTFQILSVNWGYAKGDRYTMKVVSECVSSFTPPDEFNVQPMEFNPSIFTNPLYSTVVNYVPKKPGELTGYKICAAILSAANANDILTRGSNNNQLNSTTISDPAVLALANQMVQVLSQGGDSYYLSGWKVTWSQYFYLPPPMNPGGYIEDPVTQGGLPWYFWSSDGSQSDASNIITALAAQANPSFFSGGFTWLRFADDVVKERTWFRIDHSWIGGPLGRWQESLYPQKVMN